MTVVAGIDGCRGGWLCLTKDYSTSGISARIFKTFSEVLSLKPAPEVIAVDIPIGLSNAGARECDLEARSLLRPIRSSSVFPAPVRTVLAATSYGEACEISFGAQGKKLSRQCYGIVDKIHEVDAFLQQDLARQGQVREIHPEVSFWAWNSFTPMQHSKKTREGIREREALVNGAYPAMLDLVHTQLRSRADYSTDDVLDAFAALWTAERVHQGAHRILPASPPLDETGLRMEMVV